MNGRARLSVLVGAAALALPLLGFGVLALRLPTFAEVRAATPASSATLLARDGTVLATRRIDLRVERDPWVALEDVSPRVIERIVAIEDRRFQWHAGVDPWSLLAALHDDASGRGWRGASTIPMQLVAMLDPTLRGRARRGPTAKLRQIVEALALSLRWSRREILEAYLNRADFHGGTQGLAAVMRTRYGHGTTDASDDEAWLLAAALRSPTAAPEVLARRACRLASAAAERCRGMLSLASRPDTISTRGDDLAPHLAVHLLREPGEVVRTTLDASVQRDVQATLRAQLASLSDRRVRDASAIVVDTASGEVRAWVGSAGATSTAAAVDGVVAPRQAGSTLKPFLYALALGRGTLTSASLLDDSPLTLDVPGGAYAPQDYDHQFRGLVSLRVALGGSLNVPAVRTLDLLGAPVLHRALGALGYRHLAPDPEVYGQSLALGTADVTLEEQVAAYRALASGGEWQPLVLRAGQVPARRRVFTPAVSWLVGDILADPRARSTTFGISGPLSTRTWSAVKTGTSKDMRDNWCIGWSRRYTVAVWVGNFEGDPMHDVSGVAGAAPAWSAIIDRLEQGSDASAPAPPPGLVAREVHFARDVEPARREWFLEGTEMAGVAPVPAQHAAAKIRSPLANEVLAFDPDIPRERQRVVLSAVPNLATLAWRIDGEPVAEGGQATWRLARGRHRVTLLDAPKGRAIDEVGIVVR
jgi:penicillin-binding protein 1C